MSILTKALENNIKMAITEGVMQLAAVIMPVSDSSVCNEDSRSKQR